MKNFVVTGGAGFLGSCIVRELRARGHGVSVFDRSGSQAECDKAFGPGVDHCCGSILSPESLKITFAGCDGVYHMAGALGTSELNDDTPHSVQVNIVGSLNVFDAARRCNVPYVFFPSKPNPWINAYTITKEAVEKFACLFNEKSGTRIKSLRYFNAYGPGQHIVPVRKIVPYFAVNAIVGNPLEVFGDGNQTVDMIFSEDAARITVDFAEADGTEKSIPDLGRGVRVTVNEVARDVNRFFNNQFGLKHVPMRSGEVENTILVADIAPLGKVLGPLKFTDYDQSLAKTLRYYLDLDAETIGKAVAFYKYPSGPKKCQR